MKLALKELFYSKKKYLLIEAVIVLLMFMVLFLSGLAEGLGLAVRSGIQTIPAEYFLVSDTAENLITVSNLESAVLEQAEALTDGKAAPLDIQRMYLEKENSDEKLDITYFAIPAGSFLEPEVFEGSGFSGSTDGNQIILDDNFQAEGISVGDIVRDSSTDMEFEVAGFAKDQMYGHTSVGFITTESYTKLRQELNPNYEPTYHAIVVQGSAPDNIQIEGTEVVSKADIIENLPGYTAEQSTIQMIIWVLVIASAAILGVFYYIITLQKEKQFGVMKAIGLGMGKISAVVCSQVCFVACAGACVANLLTFGMAAVLPQTMPFYLDGMFACIVTVSFILISLASSLLSVGRIAHIDPIKSIGGAE